MDSQSIGADLTYAWPTNEIAVIGAEGAANVIFRRQIADAEDPEAMRARMVKEYKAELMHPYYAAERGLVDDIIDPGETPLSIASAAMLRDARSSLPMPARQRPAWSALPRRDARHDPRRLRRRPPWTPLPPRIVLRVEKGHADPEELAAITAVLMARAAAQPAAAAHRGRDTAAWSARRASARRTAGRADPPTAPQGRAPHSSRSWGPFLYVPECRGPQRRRAIRACSTSVMSALLASARCRASVVRIGVSGPICSASRTSSGV
ncbi:hypothetical protein SMICM304S_03588 [Streptomyces microflavus]